MQITTSQVINVCHFPDTWYWLQALSWWIAFIDIGKIVHNFPWVSAEMITGVAPLFNRELMQDIENKNFS